AGKGPFDDDPGVGLSRCFSPAPRLSDVADIPPSISDVVARALDRDPRGRPTAGAFAAELRKLAKPSVHPAGLEQADTVRDEVDDLLVGLGATQTHPRPRIAQHVPLAIPEPATRVDTSPGLYATVGEHGAVGFLRRRGVWVALGVLTVLV